MRSLCIILGPVAKEMLLQLQGSFRAGVVQEITLISQPADSRSFKQSPSSRDGISHFSEQPFLPPPCLHTTEMALFPRQPLELLQEL